jgi:hypothetical protein
LKVEDKGRRLRRGARFKRRKTSGKAVERGRRRRKKRRRKWRTQ